MAQLDSASDSDSDGWRFESVWVRHFKTFVSAKVFFYACQTDSLPIADAIDTSCNNRYYARFAHYKSAYMSILPFGFMPITITLATNPFGCAIPRPLLAQRSFFW